MAFQLKSNKKETENKTIRFPLPLIEKIEQAIANKIKFIVLIPLDIPDIFLSYLQSIKPVSRLLLLPPPVPRFFSQ